MSTNHQYSQEEIWEFLSEIPDPEIPVISISELGVLRKVEVSENKVIISITPTYSGCPAMKLFEDDIKLKLLDHKISNFEIKTILTPAWTTDWITDEALKKLKKFGISPPIKGTEDKGILFGSSVKKVKCPRCDSANTKLISQFGSTACKAHYQCENCLEPFDYFKCI